MNVNYLKNIKIIKHKVSFITQKQNFFTNKSVN